MKVPKVIDAFPGFNEVDLAKFRIEYLSELVDLTIIAESRLTQSGLEKPLYFKDWIMEQNDELQKRVFLIEVPLKAEMGNWEREIFTREFLQNFLSQNFSESKFILSDLDEIPSIDQVETMRVSRGIFHFHTPTYYRRINWQLRDQHFNWARGVMGDVFLNTFPNGGRFSKEIPRIEAASGAHFSWFGLSKDSLWQKSRAAAHEELNESFWSCKELIDFCDKFRIDHLGRSRNPGFGVFRLVSKSENTVVDSISNHFPQQFDTIEKLPNIFLRICASIYISSYLRDSNLSRLKRKVIKPSFYFHKKFQLWLFPPVFEFWFTFLSHLIHHIKLYSKSLKRRTKR